jgi:peptidyl-prolyl cis-trans isomerase SurA
MKIRFFTIAVIVLALVPVVAFCDGNDPDTKNDTVVEEIIARVNNHIITRSDYLRSEEQVKNEQQHGSDIPGERASAEKDVLRDLIDQQLLLDKGDELGVNADTDLVKRLDEIRKQMNLKNMEEVEKAAQAQGVSYEEFKQNLRNGIITQQVIQREVGSHITISAEETKKFYDQHKSEMEQPEQVRLSEILVSTVPKEDKADTSKPEHEKDSPEAKAAADAADAKRVADAEAKANQLLAGLKKGAKFEDVAKKFSDGPTATQGGDLGYFKRGALAKELEDLTFGMKKDDISNVVRTKQGFVILKVTEHMQAGIPPMKDMEGKIQDAIYMKKLQPALREYLTKLREDAYIDVHQGYVDSGASPNETKPVFTTAAAEKGKKLKKKKKLGVL